MRGKGFVIRERVEEQRERVPVKEVESCEGIYSGVFVSLFSSAHGRDSVLWAVVESKNHVSPCAILNK